MRRLDTEEVTAYQHAERLLQQQLEVRCSRVWGNTSHLLLPRDWSN